MSPTFRIDTLEPEDELGPGSERIRRAHEDRDRSRLKTLKNRDRLVRKGAGTSSAINGRIVRKEAAHFIAAMSDGTERQVRTVKATTTDNPNSTLVTVGDRVAIEPDEAESDIIIHVAERKTKLSRRAAGVSKAFEQVVVANVDLLVVVAAAFEPFFRPGIIDRYIVAALEGKLSIVVAINKIDLADEEDIPFFEGYADIYRRIGYSTLLTSSTSGEGLGELLEELRGKTSVLAGHSGVGKSSLLNAIFGREMGKTGSLSKKYGKGAHTTTATSLLPIEGMDDTYIVDTPGVREFSNFELDSHNLKFQFEEFVPLMEACEIPNCSHVHEPGCAVQAAVKQGAVSEERYASYCKLYEEATADERKRIDRG